MSHLVKVLVVLLLCTVHIAVVESVKQREVAARRPLLLGDIVALGLNYLLHIQDTRI